MNRDRVTFIGSDGTRLSGIRHVGDPSLPLVLLVHGLSSNARLWDAVSERLAFLGHPVVAIDLRSHGESEQVGHGFDFATVVADLAAVLQQASQGQAKRAIVAGQSWGGNVVLQLASSHPELVRGTLLVDGGFIRLCDQFGSWDEAETALAPPDFTGMPRWRLEERITAMHSEFPSAGVTGQLANFTTDDDGSIRPRLTRQNHMSILRELYRHDPFVVASTIDSPVWILAVTTAPERHRRIEEFAALLGQGRLVWAEGHHDIHAEQPDVVSDLVLELVDATEPRI